MADDPLLGPLPALPEDVWQRALAHALEAPSDAGMDDLVPRDEEPDDGQDDVGTDLGEAVAADAEDRHDLPEDDPLHEPWADEGR